MYCTQGLPFEAIDACQAIDFSIANSLAALGDFWSLDCGKFAIGQYSLCRHLAIKKKTSADEDDTNCLKRYMFSTTFYSHYVLNIICSMLGTGALLFFCLFSFARGSV